MSSPKQTQLVFFRIHIPGFAALSGSIDRPLPVRRQIFDMQMKLLIHISSIYLNLKKKKKEEGSQTSSEARTDVRWKRFQKHGSYLKQKMESIFLTMMLLFWGFVACALIRFPRQPDEDRVEMHLAPLHHRYLHDLTPRRRRAAAPP